QLFYWQLNIVQALGLEVLRQFGYDAWLSESVLTHARNWTDRAVTAEQLRRTLGSDTAKALLVEDMTHIMRGFVTAYQDNQSALEAKQGNDASIFQQSHVQLACEYLVSVMGQAAASEVGLHKPFNWQTSQQAEQLCEQLTKTLNNASGNLQHSASFEQLQSAISKLGFQPKSAYELLATWFYALLDKTYRDNDAVDRQMDETESDNNPLSEDQRAERDAKSALRKQQLESGRHYVPEAIAILLTQLSDTQREASVQRLMDSGVSFDKSSSKGTTSVPSNLSFSSSPPLTSLNTPLNKVQSFERSTGKVSLEVQVNNLLGEHTRIHQQTLRFAVDDFVNRLHYHNTQVIPAYKRYLAMRSEILHDAKES
ncbi:MAG: DNA repair protein, partial [Psychrobacter alimentarius]